MPEPEASETGFAARTVARRVARARAALLRRFPDLAPILAGPPALTPIIVDGVAVDMALGTGRFYGDDGRAVGNRQAEQALAQPIRYRPDFQKSNPAAGAIEQRMLAALLEESRQHGLSDADFTADPDSANGLLVVLGLGLGHHLPPLIAQTQARYVLIVETEPEFVYQSLAGVDWPSLLDGIENAGGVVRLFVARSAPPLLTALRKAFGNIGIPYLDGAWFFQHYANPVLDETARGLGEAARLAYMARGFYEDERLMLTNAAANLTRHRFHLIDNRPKPRRREPALIIGSGPSLDAALPRIRQIRDGAMVFSCGTALRVCLANGIVPDFHCESENSADAFDLLSDLIAGYGSLSGITLVSSVTVDPRVPPLFDSTYLCFKELSISTGVLAGPDQEILQATPVVGNMAVRVAAALGFQTVYLFGLDCGARVAERKHAGGTAYEAYDLHRQREQALRFDLPVPGNFGGIVHTDALFNWSRTNLAASIASTGLTAWNCGDGALIEGARPQSVRALRLTPAHIDRTGTAAELRAAHAAHGPGDFPIAEPAARARADALRFFDDIRTALGQPATAIESGIGDSKRSALEPPVFEDFFDVWRRLAPFTEERPTGYGGITTIAFGSLRTLAKAGGYILRRVRNPEIRRKMLHRYLLEFHACLDALRAGTLALLDGLPSAPSSDRKPPP